MKPWRLWRVALLTLGVMCHGAVGAAEELPSMENAAKRQQAATVTVRVIGAGANSNGEAETAKRNVSVLSGAAIDKRLIVSHVLVAAGEVRLTYPGGQQAAGQVKVIDQFSGLALIQADRDAPAHFELAKEKPVVGSWVLGAAAWGAEQPLVVWGMVSGVDRKLARAGLPPLLQCDMRTAETSAGAPLVDLKGQLIGIVAAADANGATRGWTYAVPVQHVRRLTQSKPDDADGDRVVVLKRRRPVVGMELIGADDVISVRRVFDGGPAHRAGIKQGDRIETVDGLHIRSVYEAQRPFLWKQPGDIVSFGIQRDGEKETIKVVLGGGVEVSSEEAGLAVKDWFRPTLSVEQQDDGRYVARSRGNVREVFAPPADQPAPEIESEADALAGRVKLLEKALERYRQAIVYQRNQLKLREEEQKAAHQRLKSLTEELSQLKQKLTP